MNALLSDSHLSRFAGMSKKSAEKRVQEEEVEDQLQGWHI